jgi:hypothetical protein
MILLVKINIFLCPTSDYSLKTTRFTFTGFSMILELLEIFILDLILV